jgi:exonuclease VII large subunit
MINEKRNQIDHDLSQIDLKLNFRLNEAKLSYKRLNTLLEAYSSENVLKRGYTMILQDDRVIKNSSDLKDKGFKVRFHDGEIEAIKR